MNLFLVLCVLASPTYSSVFKVNGTTTPKDVWSDFEFPKDRKPTISGRIIGGSEATPHSYPFLAAIYTFTSKTISFCGGTLISPLWVITAAHCVDEKPDYGLVILGAHEVSKPETTQVRLKTSTFIVHEKWDRETLQNDVALVKLPNNVTLDEYITTVVLDSGRQNYDEHTGTVVGWGLTDDSQTDISAVLRKVNSRILTNEECKAVDPFQTIIISSHMCLDGAGPVGSCSGDSGGPLLVGHLQVGIVSFGYKTCLSGKPSVFTRVADFQDWIHHHVSKGEAMSYSLVASLTILLVHLYNYV